MRKLFFSIVFGAVLFGSVTDVWAENCTDGDLRLEISEMGSQVSGAGYPAHIAVLIKTPTPGYKVNMDDGVMTTDQQLYFTMHIKKQKNKGEEPMMSAQVISEVLFEKEIKIPSVAQGVTFSITKDYNWGPNFYKLDLSAQSLSHQVFCLKAQESHQ